jgi:TPR repeat protein
MFGRYLARGLVEATDPEAARVWLERALAQGVTEARGDLASLPATDSGAAPSSRAVSR